MKSEEAFFDYYEKCERYGYDPSNIISQFVLKQYPKERERAVIEPCRLTLKIGKRVITGDL